MLSPTKIKTSSEVEAHISNYWEWVFYVFKTISLVIAGIIIGLNPTYLASAKIYVFAIIIYILIFVVRQEFLI